MPDPLFSVVQHLIVDIPRKILMSFTHTYGVIMTVRQNSS